MAIQWDKYADVVRKYERESGLLDRTIYDLCARNPGHSSKEVIVAKVLIIGRTYATRIESQINVEDSEIKTEGLAARRLFDFFGREWKEIDRIIAKLNGIEEPLNPEKCKIILRTQSEFLYLFKNVITGGVGILRTTGTGMRTPTSFVSKYLHFHKPIVPIFDRITNKVLSAAYHLRDITRLDSDSNEDIVGDKTYADHISRFLACYEEANKRGLEPLNVKYLDYFLLNS